MISHYKPLSTNDSMGFTNLPRPLEVLGDPTVVKVAALKAVAAQLGHV